MLWDDRIGRRLRLKDLHTLQTIAEVGSMAKAANLLALSQPATRRQSRIWSMWSEHRCLSAVRGVSS